MLLELCLGYRLEHHHRWIDRHVTRDPTDSFHRLAVARHWAQEVEFEAGENYAEAVQWCSSRTPIDANAEWLRDFVQDLIVPLPKCCDSMMAESIVTWE